MNCVNLVPGATPAFCSGFKAGSAFLFSDELDDLPIFLLDDVFGNLDRQRTEVLLNALEDHAGQTFITSANPVPFNEYVSFGDQKQQVRSERWNRPCSGSVRSLR
ncbi:MAG: hypothetical protein U5K69_00575 [Balneolaceae bacterium]|nr:hypothetical protein [Balneolaceae bacterium]